MCAITHKLAMPPPTLPNTVTPPPLGDTLRALRKTRGWSLDQTAAATGVSKAMLGQIERGESSPTVATLWKLAGGLHVIGTVPPGLNPEWGSM